MVVVQHLLLGYLPCDDAFIVFRCALNLLENGLPVFNVEAPVFAGTSLSYTGALAVVSRIAGMTVPSAAGMLGILGDLAVCLLLFQLGRAIYGSCTLGLASVLLWLTNPVVALNGVAGMETSWFLVVFLGTGWALAAHRFGLAWFLALAAPWIRIDGLVILPVVVWIWWRAGRPRLERRWVVAGLLGVLGYLATTVALFGTPVPHTALAKAAGTRPSWSGAAMTLVSYALAVAGILPAWFRHVSPHVLLLPPLAVVLWDRARGAIQGIERALSRKTGARGAGARTRNRLDRQGTSRPLEADGLAQAMGERALVLLALAHAGLFVASARPSVPLYPWYHLPFVTLTLLPAASRLVRWGRALAGSRGMQERLAGVFGLVIASLWLLLPWLLEPRDSSRVLALPGWRGWVVSDALWWPADPTGQASAGLFGLPKGAGPLAYQNLGLMIAIGLGAYLAWKTFDGRRPWPDRREKGVPVRDRPRPVWGAPWGRVLLAGTTSALLVALPMWMSHADLTEKYQRREMAYLAVGRWARAHVGHAQTLGAREVGALGWAAWPLRIHDELGLVSPGALERPRRAWVQERHPALLIETSRGVVPPRRDIGLPGYLTGESPHNRLYLRWDLWREWVRGGPLLR